MVHWDDERFLRPALFYAPKLQCFRRVCKFYQPSIPASRLTEPTAQTVSPSANTIDGSGWR